MSFRAMYAGDMKSATRVLTENLDRIVQDFVTTVKDAVNRCLYFDVGLYAQFVVLIAHCKPRRGTRKGDDSPARQDG